MTEETEFETYLSITPNKFGIYVFDTKNSNIKATPQLD